MIMQQSCLKKKTGKIRRKDSKVKNRNILDSTKSRLWLPASSSLMSQRKKEEI